MKMLTDASAFVRTHLAAWWPVRRRRDALAAEYKKFAKECPLVVADMARRGMAFSSTFSESERLDAFNSGKRAYWLETLALMGMTNDDLIAVNSLSKLQEETEHDEE